MLVTQPLVDTNPAPSQLPTTRARRPSIFTYRRLTLVSVSGVLGALAFPLAFPVGGGDQVFPSGVLEPLAFVCLIPTLIALRGLRARDAFKLGFLAGWYFFTGAFWWVNVAMTTFGGMPNIASIPALLLLSAWCAFHWGLAFFLARMFERRHGWPIGWTLGPVWMATELMRNYFCSGFPWANLGYTQMRNLWLSQIGSLFGVYGVALLVAFVNGALYEVLRAVAWKERAFPVRLAAAAVGCLVLGHVYGAVRVKDWDRKLATADHIRVAVVQGNIDQKIKNTQGSHIDMVLDAFLPMTEQADARGADLIVWPEAAFPIAVPKGTRALPPKAFSSRQYHSELLLGMDVYNPADMLRGNENAAYLVEPGFVVSQEYTKHHLVPFGEYVPFYLNKILPIDNLVPGTFIPGDSLVPFTVHTHQRTAKVGVEICFDAIFPEISRAYARDGADILVNMSNDAWYGFSSAPFQFLRMVAMRAVETGRPIARAANTGISAFIDPLGRISQATPLGLVQSKDNWVDASMRVPPQSRTSDLPLVTERTLYVVIGDVPAYVASLFCVISFFIALRKASDEKSAGLVPATS